MPGGSRAFPIHPRPRRSCPPSRPPSPARRYPDTSAAASAPGTWPQLLLSAGQDRQAGGISLYPPHDGLLIQKCRLLRLLLLCPLRPLALYLKPVDKESPRSGPTSGGGLFPGENEGILTHLGSSLLFQSDRLSADRPQNFTPHSQTGSGPFTVSRSGSTEHSRASTSTPIPAARRRAAPNSGWVASLGSTWSMPAIWTMKHIPAS